MLTPCRRRRYWHPEVEYLYYYPAPRPTTTFVYCAPYPVQTRISYYLQPMAATTQQVVYPAPVMMVPAPMYGMPAYYQTAAGAPVVARNAILPPVYANTGAPQLQPQVGPQFTEDDVKQVHEMFPSVELEVVRSIMDANRGNKDATINALLQITSE